MRKPIRVAIVVALLRIPFGMSAQLQQACILVSDGYLETSEGGAVQTADGGFAIAGTRVNGSANEITLTKLDADGALLWYKTIGTTQSDWGEAIVQTNDGGFAIGGYTSVTGVRSLLLLKLDADGEFEWAKTYTHPGSGLYLEHDGLVQTSDGGYALCGGRFSFEGCFLVRTDADGVPLWSNLFEGGLTGRDVAETPEGDIVMVAGDASAKAMVARFDASGALLWRNWYNLAINDVIIPFAVTIGADSSIVVGGYQGPYSGSGAGNGGVDMVAMALEPDGTPQWVSMVGSAENEHGMAIATDADGDYILGGDLWIASNNLNSYAARLDAQGQLIWAKSFPYPATLNSILQTSIAADGDFLFTGYRSVSGMGMMKVDPASNTCPFCAGTGWGAVIQTNANILPPQGGTETTNWATVGSATFTVQDFTANATNSFCGSTAIEDQRILEPVMVVPNPFSTSTTITIPQAWAGTGSRLLITDLTGREVRSLSISTATVHVDREHLNSGAYAFRLVRMDTVLAKGVLMVTGE